jgi:hypothetical protein
MWVLFGSFFMFSNFDQLDLQKNVMLQYQIYDETYAKIGLKIGAPPI